MDTVGTAKTLEQKITRSGIFKLDERGRPIGIVKLAPDKSLSERPDNWTPYNKGQLQETIQELSREVAKFRRDRLHELQDEFKAGLYSYLKEWGLDEEKLSLHKVIEKAKRIIRKEIEIVERDGVAHRTGYLKYLWKIDANKGALIFRTHNFFFACRPKSGASIGKTDCIRYVAYLLIACGVEEGDPNTVFTRIEQAFHRYRRDFEKKIETPLPESYYEVISTPPEV